MRSIVGLTVKELGYERYWTILAGADTVGLEALDLIGGRVVESDFSRNTVEFRLAPEQTVHSERPVHIGQVIIFEA